MLLIDFTHIGYDVFQVFLLVVPVIFNFLAYITVFFL